MKVVLIILLTFTVACIDIYKQNIPTIDIYCENEYRLKAMDTSFIQILVKANDTRLSQCGIITPKNDTLFSQNIDTTEFYLLKYPFFADTTKYIRNTPINFRIYAKSVTCNNYYIYCEQYFRINIIDSL